jgi:hypothetical protein
MRLFPTEVKRRQTKPGMYLAFIEAEIRAM